MRLESEDKEGEEGHRGGLVVVVGSDDRPAATAFKLLPTQPGHPLM